MSATGQLSEHVLDEALGQRLARLMLARLGLAVAVFLVALMVLGVGGEDSAVADRGLYATLAFAFLATALYGAVWRFVTRMRVFAALQLATDVGIVTALVLFSGGADSIFSFLYLPVPVYGAVLFHRRGAYLSAVSASLGYASALLLSAELGFGATLRPGQAPEVTFALWGFHTGALLLVALLSSALVRELRIAGERLTESTSDLKRLRRLHERIVESLTSGLLTLDPDGRVTSFNPEAEGITGRPLAAVRGLLLDEVLPGASALVEGVARGPSVKTRGRMRYVDRDGSAKHLGLSSSILRDAEGEANGYVVIFQDVTDVVAMESDLRRSERLAGVGQLAADIAHEIRNPLAAISGSVEMLERELGENERDRERRRLMGIVLREIERLDRLITDFLQYARPAPPKSEPVDLGAVLSEIGEMFEASQPAGVTLETRLPEAAWVLADATQMRQVLWNLVVNAQHAVGSRGNIQVAVESRSASPQGGQKIDRNGAGEGSGAVEILVSDNGAGIAPELLERIFDPFFTTKAGGTGLGLATVHRIIEGNGGTLHVTSREGVGTEFRIHLPATEEPQ